ARELLPAQPRARAPEWSADDRVPRDLHWCLWLPARARGAHRVARGGDAARHRARDRQGGLLLLQRRRPGDVRAAGPRALLRAARRDEEGRVESEVPDSCIPDLLRGRVEDPLGRHLAGQPAADDDLALELARPPAGISEAEPVSGGVAREERPEALGRHAQE